MRKGSFPRNPKWPEEQFKRNELPSAGPFLFIVTMIFVFLLSTAGGFVLGLYLFIAEDPWLVYRSADYTYTWEVYLSAALGLFAGLSLTWTAFKAWRQAGRPIDKDAGREDW